jgi:hypothetical protein
VSHWATIESPLVTSWRTACLPSSDWPAWISSILPEITDWALSVPAWLIADSSIETGIPSVTSV